MDMAFMMAPLGVIEHHGVKGQHWGVRRYTDANGRLNAEGKARYQKYIQDYAGSDSNFGNRIAKYRAKGMSKEQAVLKAGSRSAMGRRLLTGFSAAVTVPQLAYGVRSGEHVYTASGIGSAAIMAMNHKYYKTHKLSAKAAHQYSRSIR